MKPLRILSAIIPSLIPDVSILPCQTFCRVFHWSSLGGYMYRHAKWSVWWHFVWVRSWESAQINRADDFAITGTQESFAPGAWEACRLRRQSQTDLFSFFQVCQHHYGRCLLLPNHAPNVSHCLQLWAWNETDAFTRQRNPTDSAEAWILPWAAINLFFSLKPWDEK